MFTPSVEQNYKTLIKQIKEKLNTEKYSMFIYRMTLYCQDVSTSQLQLLILLQFQSKSQQIISVDIDKLVLNFVCRRKDLE